MYGKCPVCKTDWDDGDILQVFLDQKEKGHWNNLTEEQIEEYVILHYNPPRRFSKLINISEDDSKESKYMCPDCECEFDI